MIHTTKQLLTRSKKAAITAAVIVGIGLSAIVVGGIQAQTVSAATCDRVNIIYCGLSGSSASGYINSFQNYYESNKSGHSASPTVNKNYTDVQTVFKYFGATASVVNGMNTSNTKVGYLYRDGRVVVDGKTVGTGGTVAARFSVAGATHIDGTNVYVRKTTSSFAQDKAKVIVYFKDGQMVFGVMVNCGNAIDAKPVKPEPPKPKPQSLVCKSLKSAPTSTKNQYTFTGTAETTNGATITSYQFVYGDSNSETVKTSATTATATHTYTKPGTYTAVLNVTGKVDGSAKTVTSGDCRVTITIEAPAQAIQCVSLKATPDADDIYTYTFAATASTSNGATITGYEFVFTDSDNTALDTTPVTTSATTAQTTYTFPEEAGNYFASVNVLGVANGKNVVIKGDANCATQVSIETPPVEECKPGIPEGDERCNPCPTNPELPADSPDCEEPEMPDTGPVGMLSLFGATSAAGAFGHRLFLKRRLR